MKIDELREQKKELLQQVASLKRGAEQYEKISQLATMLQDSHRFVVYNCSCTMSGVLKLFKTPNPKNYFEVVRTPVCRSLFFALHLKFGRKLKFISTIFFFADPILRTPALCHVELLFPTNFPNLADYFLTFLSNTFVRF